MGSKSGWRLFPGVPEVGKIIEVDVCSPTHYRWAINHVDTHVPLDCITTDLTHSVKMDIEENYIRQFDNHY